jgi:hypothetical protein
MAIWSKGVGFIIWFDLDIGSETSEGEPCILRLGCLYWNTILAACESEVFGLANTSKFILLQK